MVQVKRRIGAGNDGPCDANDFEPDLHLFKDVIWAQLYNRVPGFDAVKVMMNGFSGHGLQQAPAVGRGIAEHILTGGWQSLNLSDLGCAPKIFEDFCKDFRKSLPL